MRNRKATSIDTVVSVKLSEGENIIETSVTTTNGIESFRSPLYVKYSPRNPQKQILKFIGIGIDKFEDAQYDLQYSTKDIRDLSLRLKSKYGNAIVIDTIFNRNVTVSNIKAIRRKLQQTSVNDKVIVAYSGHGVLSKEFDWGLQIVLN